MKTLPVGVELFHVGGRTDGQTHRHDDSDCHFSRTRLSKAKKAMYSTYNVILWRVRVTVIAVGTQQCILCVLLKLHVTANCIKMFSVAQQWWMANLCRRLH